MLLLSTENGPKLREALVRTGTATDEETLAKHLERVKKSPPPKEPLWRAPPAPSDGVDL